MRLTKYRGYEWESYGYHAGIPSSPVYSGSVQPSIIYRPRASPVFGPGSATEMTVPVEFIYNGSETYETAWAKLLEALRPLDTTPSPLWGELNDGTVVYTDAIFILSPQYDADVNVLYGSFVSVDGKFREDKTTSATGTFSSSVDTALRCAITGTSRTNAVVRLKPTTASSSGWKYRRRYTITSTLSQSLSSYPWALDIGDTSGLVSGAKALSSGDDLRVLVSGVEVSRTLVDWNVSGTNTLVWFLIDAIPANGTLKVDVIYGNSSASSPPTLAYPSKPAFDISTSGANRSTNAKWVYAVDTVSGNAAKGGWYIDTGSAPPSVVNTSIPGAWRPVKTFPSTNADDFLQPDYSSYVDTLTYYMGRFEATRARFGTIANSQARLADGVALSSPLGITSVEASLNFLNETTTTSGTTPVGKLVILYRSLDTANWVAAYTNAAAYSSSTAIASATYSTATATQVAFAVWPYDSVGVPSSASAGQEAVASWGGTLKVNISTAKLSQALTTAETSVYEMRSKVRLDRDGTDGVVGHQVLLGNYGGSSGAGTPHLLVELNQQVEVTGSTRSVRVKSSSGTVVETVPSGCVSYTSELIDLDGNTSTGLSGSVLELRPENPSYVANPSFSTTANDWTRSSVSAGTTAAALARDTSVYSSSPASGKMTISASGASGSSVVDVSSNYISLGSVAWLSVGADVRTTSVNLIPRLVILWYDSAKVLLSTSTQATWSPTANTWYRRVYGAAKPDGASFARVGLATYTGATSATGSTYLDTVVVLGNDLQVFDLGGGSVTVTADWIERYG